MRVPGGEERRGEERRGEEERILEKQWLAKYFPNLITIINPEKPKDLKLHGGQTQGDLHLETA